MPPLAPLLGHIMAIKSEVHGSLDQDTGTRGHDLVSCAHPTAAGMLGAHGDVLLNPCVRQRIHLQKLTAVKEETQRHGRA